MYKGSLDKVLSEIGIQLGLPSADLIAYANEAPHAETRPDGRAWPTGTGSISEKRIVYAITRAINPALLLDIGTRWGTMAMQSYAGAKAAERPTQTIKAISVDVEKTIQGSRQPVGKFIPKSMDIELVTADAVAYLKNDDKIYDFIFEDTDHTYEMTKAIYELIGERLAMGGIIISHDAVHPKFKNAVVKGISAAGINPYVYLVEGDSCGLSIWKNPEAQTPSIKQVRHETQIDDEKIEEAPKRRKRRRKKASKIGEGL